MDAKTLPEMSISKTYSEIVGLGSEGFLNHVFEPWIVEPPPKEAWAPRDPQNQLRCVAPCRLHRASSEYVTRIALFRPKGPSDSDESVQSARRDATDLILGVPTCASVSGGHLFRTGLKA